jgi:peptidylprolyl isomerase
MKNSTTAEYGHKVKIHLIGILPGGNVVYDSRQKSPLQIELGKSDVIKGVQDAIVGMKPKEQKKVIIPPESGFGKRDDKKIRNVQRAFLPDDIEYVVGRFVPIPRKNGDVLPAKVMAVSDQYVKLDLNHPLAGKTLECELNLLSIDIR